MTTVLALRNSQHAILAADRLCSWGPGSPMLHETKLVTVGRFVLGICGDARVQNILAESTICVDNIADLSNAMYNVFAANLNTNNDEGSKSFGSSFLALDTVADTVHFIGADLYHGEIDPDVAFAIGSGRDYAIGALQQAINTSPTTRRSNWVTYCHQALHVAAQFDTGTGVTRGVDIATRDGVRHLPAL